MIYTFLVGRLGADCVVRQTPNGTAVCNFNVAGDVGFGEHKQTLWFDCSLWGKRAESKLQYMLTKGAKVVVAGEQGSREYNGKTYITLKVSEIDVVEPGGQGQKEPASPPASGAAQNAAPSEPDPDDDIPF